MLTAEKDFTKITVQLEYTENANAAVFDSLFLCRDLARCYQYDQNGNPITVTDYAGQQQQFDYAGSNLSRILNPTGSSYEYTYDDSKNLTHAVASDGTAVSAEYDRYGNAVSASVRKISNAVTVQNGKTYFIRLKSNGKYLTAKNAGTTDGTDVIAAEYTGNPEQQWTAEKTVDGFFTFRPVHAPGMTLDVTGGFDRTGLLLELFHSNAGAAQKYRVPRQNDFTYQLSPLCSKDGKVLSLTD